MTIDEWKKDFKSFINELWMPRDDYNGIMAYIDEGAELLEEQEAVKPEMFDTGDGWVDCYCGNCKHDLLSFCKSLNIVFPKYCSNCGRAVRWDA